MDKIQSDAEKQARIERHRRRRKKREFNKKAKKYAIYFFAIVFSVSLAVGASVVLSSQSGGSQSTDTEASQ